MYQNTAKKFMENKIYSHNLLSKKEERRLIKKAQKGDKTAKNKLVESNMKLIRKIAQKRKNFYDVEDLEQYGVIGLIKAIEKFDLNKKNRLSTFAYNYIRKYIDEGIRKASRNVKLPKQVWDDYLFNECEKAEKHFKNSSTISCDKKNEEEDYYELNANPLLGVEDNFVEQINNKEILKEVYEILTPKERDIIDMRFGLKSFKRHTLKEISNKYNVHKQAVDYWLKKIFKKAKDKIEH